MIAVVDGLKGFPEAFTASVPAGDGAYLHRPSLAPQRKRPVSLSITHI